MFHYGVIVSAQPTEKERNLAPPTTRLNLQGKRLRPRNTRAMTSAGRLILGLSVVVTAGCVVGCNNNQISPPNIQTARQAWHPESSATWRPESSDTLLYVSSALYATYVYTYPKLKLLGSLQGLVTPMGECVDQSGDVWVTDDNQVVEYKHGSLTPTSVLSDPGQVANACSVDPKGGDLAVSNYGLVHGGPGSIAIYKNARGNPTLYSDPNVYRPNALSYGGDGTLYLDGENESGGFQLSELSRGGTFTDLTLSGASITFPGGVQYVDGKVIVGDQTQSKAYRTTIKGSIAKVTGTTKLPGTNQVYQFFITGSKLFAVDGGNGDVRIYPYPRGVLLAGIILRGSAPTAFVLSKI
jgi:hypothetical protein